MTIPSLAPAHGARRVAVIVALLVVVFGLRLVIATPVVGVGFLYLVPIILAAVWLGRIAAVGVGLVSAGLFFLGATLQPQPYLVASGLMRVAIFCSVGYGFAVLVQRERRSSSALALQERELDELRALRSALVPAHVPDRPAVELATCFVPAQSRVAGDFFMVGEGPGDATVVVVGDVVGKGIEAARRATFVRTALTAFAPYNDDPCRLLELANGALVERAGISEEFVTAACLVFRPSDHSIAWSLAGHPPPMLLDRGERLNGLEPGLPLGIADRVECERGERPITAGDGVLLFTDGLTEARRPFADAVEARRVQERPPPELFGSDRIAEVLSEHAGEEPGKVVRALRAAAERFTGGGLADDLCMVAVRARV